MKQKSQVLSKVLIITVLIFLFSTLLWAAELGDVNNNASVDIVDALLIAQYYVGLDPTVFDPSVADVDCNGSINIVDALLIAQYYVGLVLEFPCATLEPTPTSTPVPIEIPTPISTPDPTPESPADGELKAQYRCGEAAVQTSQVKPVINIINTGTASVLLSEVTLRYYYTKEGSASEEFNVDYAVMGSEHITGNIFAGYLDMGFIGSAGSLSPGASTGEIQLRINKTDWSNYDQADDYSFDPSKTALEEWYRVTLFRGGSMIWGTDPDGNTPGPTQAPTPTPMPTPIPPPQIYYIDSQIGNDLSDGKSESIPWQNCPGMPDWSGTTELHAGDTVYFNNARTWTGGTGDALIAVTGGVTYDGRSWGSGTRAVLRASGDLNRSVINIREDHPDIPTEVIGFEIDAGGYITTGIGVNWPHSVPNIDGAVKRFIDCVIHGVYSEANQNQYEYGIAISSGYGGGCTVENIEIIDCTTYDISRGGINIYSANDDPASNIKNVLVQNCDISGSGTDPSYAGSQLNMKNHIINCIFEYNYVHDAERGAGISFSTHPEVGFRGPENCVMRYNIVTGSKHAGILFGGEGAMSIDIYGNIVTNNFYSSFRMLSGLNAVMNLKVYNNTFFKSVSDPPGNWSPEVSIDSNPSVFESFEFKNNILYSTEYSPAAVINVDCITSHSNNIYYREGEINPQLVRYAGTYYSQTSIQEYEPTAVHANPMFKNPDSIPAGFTSSAGSDIEPVTDGFSLFSGSPALDAGVSVGAPYDLSINSALRPAGLGWDIGAYEQ